MFRKMPIILLAVIILLGVIHPYIPLQMKSIIYGISLSLKSVIVFLLPLIIFGLLFKTAAQMARKASKMIVGILLAICCSNFLSTLISYLVGSVAYQFDLSMTLPQEGASLTPAWSLSLPKWIGNDHAMLGGILLGIVLGWVKPQWAEALSSKFEKVINHLLKAFLLMIPVFIAGFILKMYHDQMMTHILKNYAVIFIVIGCALFAYICFIYGVVNRFHGRSFIQSLKNMLPAAIAGFGTMSSAAAMPLTILGTEKNSQNSDFARSVIPATVNTHLIGDCFAIPIFAFAVLKNFGMSEPTFIGYLIFAAYFVLAKFSVAAVPGGGILVMLPILENYLGFDAAMLSLITALYILFDPIITCANVVGNGGFALVMSRLFKRPTVKV